MSGTGIIDVVVVTGGDPLTPVAVGVTAPPPPQPTVVNVASSPQTPVAVGVTAPPPAQPIIIGITTGDPLTPVAVNVNTGNLGGPGPPGPAGPAGPAGPPGPQGPLFPDAPINSLAYGRNDAAWVRVLAITNDILDAGNF
jgi:hypothetical protein